MPGPRFDVLLAQFYLHFTSAFILFLLPIACTALPTYLLTSTIRRDWRDPTTASFAAFGCVIGMFIGYTKQEILDTVFPLIIAMITVFITYLFDKKNSPIEKKTYMASLLAFFVFTAFGFYYGVQFK